MSDTPKQTVIEDGTEFDGSIRSSCAISLSGKIKGEVEAPSLDVSRAGSVEGRVLVKQLKSQGEISGEIEADSVELAGQVCDRTVINAKTLEVKLDQPGGGYQVTFGNCELRVSDPVAKGIDMPAVDVEAKKKEKHVEKDVAEEEEEEYEEIEPVL